jgi:hypothetical protein
LCFSHHNRRTDHQAVHDLVWCRLFHKGYDTS